MSQDMILRASCVVSIRPKVANWFLNLLILSVWTSPKLNLGFNPIRLPRTWLRLPWIILLVSDPFSLFSSYSWLNSTLLLTSGLCLKDCWLSLLTFGLTLTFLHAAGTATRIASRLLTTWEEVLLQYASSSRTCFQISKIEHTLFPP